MIEIVVVLIAAYLLGSIPFSHIFPKIKGKDVAASGTKNVGATNALVVAGPIMGALAFMGDIGKGYLAVYLAERFVGVPWIMVLAAILVILGHDFSVFLRFKGGKGIAPYGGALLRIEPIFTVIILLIWILLIVVTRYIIPSTIVMLAVIPVFMYVIGLRVEFIVFACLSFLLALYTHRRDIQRFMAGKELNTSDAMQHYLKK